MLTETLTLPCQKIDFGHLSTRCAVHTRQHVSIPVHNFLSAKTRRFSRLIYHQAILVHDSVSRHCRVRGGVLESELGRELAIDSARKVDPGLYSVDGTKDMESHHTDLSLVFETRSCILSVL